MTLALNANLSNALRLSFPTESWRGSEKSFVPGRLLSVWGRHLVESSDRIDPRVLARLIAAGMERETDGENRGKLADCLGSRTTGPLCVTPWNMDSISTSPHHLAGPIPRNRSSECSMLWTAADESAPSRSRHFQMRTRQRSPMAASFDKGGSVKLTRACSRSSMAQRFSFDRLLQRQ
jgi:hypothetical protein